MFYQFVYILPLIITQAANKKYLFDFWYQVKCYGTLNLYIY